MRLSRAALPSQTDHYPDYIEVDELLNTPSATIAAKTEAHFVSHGVHEMILMHLNLLHQNFSVSAKGTRLNTLAHLTGPREMESPRHYCKSSSAS